MNFFGKKGDETFEGEKTPLGLTGMLRRTMGSIRAMINSRLELIVCELQEEKQRLVSLLIFGIGGVFLGFLGLISATAAVAIYFSANIFAVLLGFSIFYLAAALGFFLVLRRRIREPVFPETAAQLKKDRAEFFD